jgi:hypothetical protein
MEMKDLVRRSHQHRHASLQTAEHNGTYMTINLSFRRTILLALVCAAGCSDSTAVDSDAGTYTGTGGVVGGGTGGGKAAGTGGNVSTGIGAGGTGTGGAGMAGMGTGGTATAGTGGMGTGGTGTGGMGTGGFGMMATCDTTVMSVTKCGTAMCPAVDAMARQCTVNCCMGNTCGTTRAFMGQMQPGQCNVPEPPPVVDPRCPGETVNGAMLDGCCDDMNHCGLITTSRRSMTMRCTLREEVRVGGGMMGTGGTVATMPFAAQACM